MIIIICGTMGGYSKESLASAMLFESAESSLYNNSVPELKNLAVLESSFSSFGSRLLMSTPVPFDTNYVSLQDDDVELFSSLLNCSEQYILYVHEALWGNLIAALAKHQSGKVKFMIPVGTSMYYEDRAIQSVKILLDRGFAPESEIILVLSYADKNSSPTKYNYPFSSIHSLLSERPGINIYSRVLVDITDVRMTELKDYFLSDGEDVYKKMGSSTTIEKLYVYKVFEKVLDIMDSTCTAREIRNLVDAEKVGILPDSLLKWLSALV